MDAFPDDCRALLKIVDETDGFLVRRDRIEVTQPVTVLPGIDTIVATNADVTLLGHGYVSESRGVH